MILIYLFLLECFLISNISRCKSSPDPNCEYFSTEMELIQGFLTFYHKCDPDILVGYEIEKSSWGYLMSRAVTLGFDIQSHLSRLKPIEKKNGDGGNDYQRRTDWDGSLIGRIILNLWKLLRHEVNNISMHMYIISSHFMHLFYLVDNGTKLYL
jgi:DNA polymerase zeta